DNDTAPTVTMTQPVDGAIVSGSTVILTATATDDFGVSGVQFLLDGAALGAEDTSAPYTLAWNTLGVTKGAHQLAARARDTINQQTTSTIVNVTVAKALPTGAGQTLSVTFTPTDTANYATTTASVLITVTKATPVITWPTPANITYGTALSATQLNATTPVPGTFAYTPAAGTVLLVGAAQTLSTTFTPTDASNYNSATASVSITVVKATPVITWPAP